MPTDHPPRARLLARSSECRCENCPPDRVCAWACVQGTSYADIVIGAMLEESQSWALQPPTEAAQDTVQQALWETFNR